MISLFKKQGSNPLSPNKKKKKLITSTLQVYSVTSSISALAGPYSSRALSTTMLGTPNLSAILIAFERPKTILHCLSHIKSQYNNTMILLKNQITSSATVAKLGLKKLWCKTHLTSRRQSKNQATHCSWSHIYDEYLVLPRESCKLASSSLHQTPYKRFQRYHYCQRCIRSRIWCSKTILSINARARR